jgi:hypothetical protein
MVFWKFLSTWSHAANLDDLVASRFLPTSQVEAEEVEIFLSSQSSRIVNMEKSSIVYSFLVRAHNLQILRIEQGSTPGSIKAFAKLLFVAIANVKHYALSFLVFPHHDQFFPPLTSSSSVSRPYDAVTSLRHLFSANVLTTLRPHELTLLSSVLSTPDTRMVKRPLQPRSGYKREPFTQNRRCESSISV